ncbi:Cloroperoxidase [Aspergillus piperis CBS 112811]|uniref:Cloroperoxidase n=1 Tax=Aspergillus piperis CBS 112811 TaxID=1448313 RepID=A0A8G1R1C2_9EURO|nr:Cloroperoxidase [Aspergillus piperis CBS 112811]RAH56712.1 Cloroperoxidase [Aspergillus piperis CBS 112811]
MKASLLSVLSSFSLALATDSAKLLPWSPPGHGDVRGPCPMLNTLANHGLLPHNGKDISEEDIVDVLGNTLNVAESLAVALYKEAMTTVEDPNATTFSLSDLDRPGILEHDASLSRQDPYFGNDHEFNEKIFDQTKSYWTSPLIDIEEAAEAHEARWNTSKATNPDFNISETGTAFSFGESAAYMLAFEEDGIGYANRSWVVYFFENERLPQELGWTKRPFVTTGEILFNLTQRIVNSTVGVTPEVIAKLKDFAKANPSFAGSS